MLRATHLRTMAIGLIQVLIKSLTGLDVINEIWKLQVSVETGKINMYHVLGKQAKSMTLESEFLVSMTSSITTSGVTQSSLPWLPHLRN